MAIESFYTSTAVVQQRDRTPTGMGGIKSTYSTRIASLPCRVSLLGAQLRSSETDEYGKMTTTDLRRLYCEASSATKAIDASDRIVVDSKTYEIKGISNPGLQDHHLEIELRILS